MTDQSEMEALLRAMYPSAPVERYPGMLANPSALEQRILTHLRAEKAKAAQEAEAAALERVFSHLGHAYKNIKARGHAEGDAIAAELGELIDQLQRYRSAAGTAALSSMLEEAERRGAERERSMWVAGESILSVEHDTRVRDDILTALEGIFDNSDKSIYSGSDICREIRNYKSKPPAP